MYVSNFPWWWITCQKQAAATQLDIPNSNTNIDNDIFVNIVNDICLNIDNDICVNFSNGICVNFANDICVNIDNDVGVNIDNDICVLMLLMISVKKMAQL